MEKVFLGRFGNRCIYNDCGFLVVIEDGEVVERSDYQLEDLGGSHDYYTAKNDDGFGMVKNDGTVLIDFGKYDFFLSIQFDVKFMGCKDIIKVAKNGKMGLVGDNGQELIPPIYDDIRFVASVAMVKVRNGEKVNLIFSDGKSIELWDNYDLIESFDKDLFKVSPPVGNDYCHYFGLINSYGDEVLPCVYTSIEEIECNGEKTGFFLVGNSDLLFGVIDEHGNVIVPERFKHISYWPEGYFRVEYSDNECGIYDVKGNVIVPHFYKFIIKSNHDGLDGFLVETQDDLWGWYDIDGTKRMEPSSHYIYRHLRVFGDCFVTIEKDLCGVKSPDGKQILKNKYLSINPVVYEGKNYVEVETRFHIKKYVDKEGQEYRLPKQTKGD